MEGACLLDRPPPPDVTPSAPPLTEAFVPGGTQWNPLNDPALLYESPQPEDVAAPVPDGGLHRLWWPAREVCAVVKVLLGEQPAGTDNEVSEPPAPTLHLY